MIDLTLWFIVLAIFSTFHMNTSPTNYTMNLCKIISFVHTLLSISLLVHGDKTSEEVDEECGECAQSAFRVKSKRNLKQREQKLLNSPKNFTIMDNGTQSVVFQRDQNNNIISSFFDNVVNKSVNSTQFSKVITRFKQLLEKIVITEQIKIDITYRLYNQKCRNGEIINYDYPNPSRNWIPGSKVVFIIHGWWQSGERDIFSDILVGTSILPSFQTSILIKDAYIDSKREENVIIVNWNSASRKPYIVSAKDTKLVGEAVAHMIIFLKRQYLFQYSQLKIVGFSLGAHVAGSVGHYIQEKLFGVKIEEITGLDPAGPLFDPDYLTTQYNLDKTDAKFVQVLHCNMGSLYWPLFPIWDPHLGSISSAAHVNFYLNGGADQPNCGLLPLIKSGCSHLRCGELYALTVKGKSYKGCPCDSAYRTIPDKCIECECDGPSIGDMCPQNATGSYCVQAIPSKLFT